ncbi:unnamed protein product, partial [Symbiodinium pilosum]
RMSVSGQALGADIGSAGWRNIDEHERAGGSGGQGGLRRRARADEHQRTPTSLSGPSAGRQMSISGAG